MGNGFNGYGKGAVSQGATFADPAYKSKMCTFFMEHGVCKKGLNCNYAHDARELASEPIVGIMQQPYAVPGDKGFGGCKGYGKYAPYAAASPAWPQAPAKGSAVPNGSPFGVFQDAGPRTCSYFLQGQCKKGAACQFLHPGSDGSAAAAGKTKMCKFFLEGTCKKGEGCNFAHSEEELSFDAQSGASLSEAPLL